MIKFIAKFRVLKGFQLKNVLIGVAAITILSACGGGSDSDSNNGSGGGSGFTPPPSGVQSTITSATQGSGSITYQQYYTAGNWTNKYRLLPNPDVSFPTTKSNVTFSSGSGVITFFINYKNPPVEQRIATTNSYSDSTWSGALSQGKAFYGGNLLLGCDISSVDSKSRTQIFVADTLARTTDMKEVDVIYGKNFDVYYCSGIGGVDILTEVNILARGEALWGKFSSVKTDANNLVNTLNMATSYGSFGGYLGGAGAVNNGSTAAYLYRYKGGGAEKYAIVMRYSRDSGSIESGDYLLIEK